MKKKPLLFSYPQHDYLMTLFLAIANASKAAYNVAHIATRGVVERTIGVWKQRFRCINQSAGYIMSEPGYAANIVLACAILHNMAIRNGIELDIPDDEELVNQDGQNQADEENAGDEHAGHRNQELQRGLNARNCIVTAYFQRE